MESESRSRSVSPVSSSDSSPPSSPLNITASRGRKKGRGQRKGINAAVRGPRGGRGRGRGGQRSRGRGRQQTGPNRIELAIQARNDRKTQLEARISSMDLASLRETLRLVCTRDPSLLLDIFDSNKRENSSPPHSSTRTAPSWCICSYCRELPTEKENVCCGKTPQNCHTQLADFYTIVLDELVLEVAIRSRNDALAEPRDNNYNKAHRHAAYRQYIMWIHGHRKVIPSCCVCKIREKYPEPSGHYTGYIEGVLDN